MYFTVMAFLNCILYLTCVCDSSILPEINHVLHCGINTNRYRIGRDISMCRNGQNDNITSIEIILCTG